MNPGSDTQNGWGRPAWAFLHAMTLDPSAGDEQRAAQKEVLRLLCYVLPCPTCRESYQEYCKILGLTQCRLDQLGDFVCNVHDKVNLKLNKPAKDFPADFWKFQLLENPNEIDPSQKVFDMFYFLFAIAANYPARWAFGTQLSKHYQEFFTTLPRAINHTAIGKCMEEYIRRVPLTNLVLANRSRLTRWLYGMFSKCAYPSNGKDDLKGQGDVPSLEEITSTINSIRVNV